MDRLIAGICLGCCCVGANSDDTLSRRHEPMMAMPRPLTIDQLRTVGTFRSCGCFVQERSLNVEDNWHAIRTAKQFPFAPLVSFVRVQSCLLVRRHWP